MPEPAGIKVTYNDFPDGLRCCDCGNEIPWGDRYSERLEGLMGDEFDDLFAELFDEPVAEVSLICLKCARPKYIGTGEIIPLYDENLNRIEDED